MRTFADRLREIVAGNTLAFAKQCGLPVSSLRLYLDGRASPSAGAAARIATAAGVSLQWLVSGEGTPAAEGPAAVVPPDRTLH